MTRVASVDDAAVATPETSSILVHGSAPESVHAATEIASSTDASFMSVVNSAYTTAFTHVSLAVENDSFGTAETTSSEHSETISGTSAISPVEKLHAYAAATVDDVSSLSVDPTVKLTALLSTLNTITVTGPVTEPLGTAISIASFVHDVAEILVTPS